MNPAIKHVMRFFKYGHLKAPLAEVSKDAGTLAEKWAAELPENPEKTVALRKLLEAKDAAVRAMLPEEPNA